jgi:predicted dehydrogenase
MNLHHITGVDEATTILLTFPTTTPRIITEWGSQAIAMTHLRVSTDPDQKNAAGPAVRIQGTKGEIQVDGPTFRPERYRIIPRREGPWDRISFQEFEHPIPLSDKGMYWEADEVARCIRDGKIQSETLEWDEMITIMEVMDEARKQGGLIYPEEVESAIYSS